ncbi:unnamed protein product [Rotaria magnacalcarata]|uniref:Reverse transcriptase domain-containing protein n=1 Tax=Rotaria magnacalcarata TaxID=392030 RepID=A0A816XAP7_9BILA|nr:unnamed protein product [Rotaria magnacalcarata]CAF4306584.1 unnamed protein product [Rotaria magnacalcarata]
MLEKIFEKLILKKSKNWIVTHNRKLESLRTEYNRTQEDPNISSIDPIKNYSKRKLTSQEHAALINGLDFVYHNLSFNDKDFISNVETFFVSLLGRCTDKYDWEEKDIDDNTIYNLTPEQLQYAAKLRSISDRFKRNAIKELKSYKNNHKEYLSSLRKLAQDKSIYITRPDKGKGVVILDRNEYIKKMHEILNDSSTFKTINHDPTLKKENKLKRILCKMKKRGFLSENELKQVTPCGSHCARLYGLPKVHKTGIPLRPVISSIGSYNYRLAKLLAAKLQPLRKNKYILKDTFDFIESIKKLNPTLLKHRMVSFDVTSLFTKVPLSYTINLILDKMYGPEHYCPKFIKVKSDWCSKCLNRHDMKTLLDIATSDTHFSFNNLHYQQHNGVAMGSPLAPVLADIFMIHLENKLMDKLKKAGVLWYKRYVDDTFVIIRKKAKINNIKKILNSLHKDIQFTSVQEQNNELSFLDVLVRRNNKRFETSVYRKPTYTNLLLKWSSFVPKSYKISAISCMVYRAIHISSSFTIMHKEFEFIRDITKLNGYPKYFVECQIRHTLNRYIEKQSILNKDIKTKHLEQKQDNKETHIDRIVVNVPYAEKATRQFSKEINKLAKKVKPTSQIIIVPRPPPAVKHIFKNKDEIPKNLKSHVVYQLSCNTCSEKYIGKTVRQASRRLKEHGAPQTITTIEPSQYLRRSERIANNKKLQIYYGESDSNTEEEVPQINTASAIQQHITSTNHKIDWNNWLILDSDNHPYRLLVKESLAIIENSPSLNRTTRSTPLVVYPEGSMKRPTRIKTTSQDSK